MTNLHCSVWTPIKLPTWDHIGQMTRNIRNTNRPWSFFKADHESAYKQLPLDPDQAHLAMVALRHPVSGLWYAFAPRALLFGAEAAVTHYNCLSRAIAVLTNMIFGIPMLAYFDDFGALAPEDLGPEALAVFKIFTPVIGFFLNGKKFDIGRALTFLGIFGRFPGPDNDMTLVLSLPADKAARWAGRIR